MQYGPDYKFWVVVDARTRSELADVLFQASLADLELQFKGGLRAEENPTLFTDQEEAEAEARRRLVARHVFDAVALGSARVDVSAARSIDLRDEKGKVVLHAEIGGPVR